MLAKLALLTTTSFALLATAQNCSVLSTNLLCCEQTQSGGTITGLNCSSTNLAAILLGGCLTGNLACCDNNGSGIGGFECEAPALLPSAVLSVLGSNALCFPGEASARAQATSQT
ncbi:hypothetical protein A0H81_02276 [Grifola frondosa]|uniref:Hydrophobin n=1 Tax=Grifola frondosa TaxID=5627 RepID=A0A1C7ML89_GRIFR|nr:hypothetical protein A0H81_02276 [Grifola frondosa]